MSEPLPQRIAEEARKRSVRFSDRAWNAWLDQGGLRVAEALHPLSWSAQEKDAVIEATLRLTAEAVSCGYLSFGESTNSSPWFPWAWNLLLPTRLARSTPQEAISELSTLWNLSEKLEIGPPWLRRLFELSRSDLRSEETLNAFLSRIETRLQTAGLPALPARSDRWRSGWVDADVTRPYALPESVTWIAPRIAAIATQGSEGVTLVLLTPTPVVLGSGPRSLLSTATASDASEATDPAYLHRERIGTLRTSARNEWFWAGIPEYTRRVFFAWGEAGEALP
jgi:hypothetical protein